MRKALAAATTAVITALTAAQALAGTTVYRFNDAKLTVDNSKVVKCHEGVLETRTQSLFTKRPALLCGDTVYLPAFEVTPEKGARPLPKSTVERIPVYRLMDKEQVEAVRRAVEAVEDYGIKPAGDGKEILVVFLDPLCPFCRQGVKTKLSEVLKKFKVVAVPYPVHGSTSIYGSAYLLKEMKEKGLEQGLRDVFSHWKLDSVPTKPEKGESYSQFLKRRSQKIGLVTFEYSDWLIRQGRGLEKEVNLVKQVAQDVRGIVEGTPTFVLCKPDWSKCWIGVGMPPLGKFILQKR